MKKLHYSIDIKGSPQHVWETMTHPETYKQWVKPFSPNSQYRGEWQEGSEIVFFDPDIGGTKAVFDEVIPFERIRARHIALVGKDGSTEDVESEPAQKWIGSTETYTFAKHDGVTTLTVDVSTHEDFVSMFDTDFPKALELLKGICETS